MGRRIVSIPQDPGKDPTVIRVDGADIDEFDRALEDAKEIERLGLDMEPTVRVKADGRYYIVRSKMPAHDEPGAFDYRCVGVQAPVVDEGGKQL